jgi:SAM-dependent methyltransferase
VIVDLGCGPGMQTLELARLSNSRVVAIDNHEPFLRELTARAADEGLQDLVDVRVGEMQAPGFAPGSVNLLWCEGAIYIVGFENGLMTWRPMLGSRGNVAVTEAAWLAPGAPEELRRFWQEGYPAMASREENLPKAERCGYRVLEHFDLPAEAWWTHYYSPIERRLGEFRSRYAGNAEALAAIDAEAVEIDLFRRYHEYYGYVFYVLERVD